MIRRLRTKQVDRAHASVYLQKARGFRADAEAMSTLAGAFSGNGLAVMCVHAAIAYADALSIRAGGVKSTSGEHADAVDVLESTLRIHGAGDAAAVKALRYVLQRKDEVSYVANLVRQEDAARVLEKLVAFGDWAEVRFEQLA